MKTKREKVFEELKRAKAGKPYSLRLKEAGPAHLVPRGWVPSRVLHDLAGWRFGARLYELRKDGVEIESRPFRDPDTGKATDVYLYRATHIPQDEDGQE